LYLQYYLAGFSSLKSIIDGAEELARIKNTGRYLDSVLISS
jgi:hypothetical protein